MKISEVMELTGLTKKAINYYEQQGLVKPDVNEDNNYRDYSVEDVNRLIQISIFRRLDVPVKEIARLFEKPDYLKTMLQMHKEKLEEDMDRIKKNKNVVDTCLKEYEKYGAGSVTTLKRLSVLDEVLELNEKRQCNFMKKELGRIFPGIFGKIMALMYGKLLNEPIDTPQKEEAWREIVKFLDDANPIEYSETINEMFLSGSDGRLEEMEEEFNEMFNSLISSETDMIENYREKMSEEVDKAYLNLSEEMKERIKVLGSFKRSIQDIGFNDNFHKNMTILSSNYKKYFENFEKMIEPMANKLKDIKNKAIT
ncbi:MerR family transcriptional regulator [Herbivorax sp. ANBcel31]|uniref:MerR family transcriptional regulator n=1 Tax=Herbivorax sp. ANBcel31 TaxID=3069754 RepID=UPI0027B0BFEC|nr:MerR family transcriptional regulator [Herbivorax sp. ANBcel31]MDQ2086228.1 MerR family transcriptional regulator [Herbivorax sp. ANBcel31]